MMFALEHVAWEACLVEPRADRALEAHARRVQGLPNPSLRYFSSVPWLARALVDLHPENGLLIRLDQEVADLVALVVSQENACRFCYAAVRALLWAQGMDKARIERVEQDLMRADLPPRTLAAIVFGRAQSRSGPPVARAAGAALREAGFDADELREIAYAVAVTDFSNRVFTISAIPSVPLERMPDRLLMQLLRPLIGLIVRRHHLRGREQPQRSRPSPPYARLGEAYAGSPIAPMLAAALENMWASPHLTRRCKLLLLAVVTRGLMCEAGALDIAQALRGEGLTDAALDRILDHLDGPELDPVERLLVRFARETIWYEPAMLQRHARALLERLSAPQLLEAIGVTSLGNGALPDERDGARRAMTQAFVAGAGLLLLTALAISLALARRRGRRLQAQLDAAHAELQHLQDACARLAPAGVVQRLVADSAIPGFETPAERKIVTALFADLVGYTALSERLEAATLARVLNGYFQRMSDAIHEHCGHVSTFLGDGLLAYFGALQPNPWQCNDAARAALAMQQALRDYNAELEAQGLPPLAVGIGIHRGPGLAGLIGSRERMEYGFVGRTVNLAARVQALTRTHGVGILVTEALRTELDTRFELTPMPAEHVKGIAEPVMTYALRAAPADSIATEAEATARSSVERISG